MCCQLRIQERSAKETMPHLLGSSKIVQPIRSHISWLPIHRVCESSRIYQREVSGGTNPFLTFRKDIMKLNKIIRRAVLHPPVDLVQPFGDTSFFVTLMHLYHMYVQNFNRFCLHVTGNFVHPSSLPLPKDRWIK